MKRLKFLELVYLQVLLIIGDLRIFSLLLISVRLSDIDWTTYCLTNHIRRYYLKCELIKYK